MPKINTSVLIGDTIYPAGSTISKELAKQVDDKSVFGDDDTADVDVAAEAEAKAAAEKEAAEAAAAGHPVGDPVIGWKGDELDAYAKAKGFDISGANNKQEKVDAIAAATAATSGS